MSAEAMKEFKDNHAWLFSDHAKDMDKSSIHSDEAHKKTHPSTKESGLVEI
jgi:hypothetical protein